MPCMPASTGQTKNFHISSMMTEQLVPDDPNIDIDDLIWDEDGPPAAIVEALAPVALREDPSAPPGYPRGLVLDLVLKVAPVADIISAYKIPPEEFKRLTLHPVFVQDLRDMKQRLREEGFSFRVKAAAQAEAYLSEAWRMVHDSETPANVRADLVKWTTAVAGLSTNPQKQISGIDDTRALMEQLKTMPVQELEMRVLRVIMKHPLPMDEKTYEQ